MTQQETFKLFASGFETGPVANWAGQKTRGPNNLNSFCGGRKSQVTHETR
jgi:hypothetical protein